MLTRDLFAVANLVVVPATYERIKIDWYCVVNGHYLNMLSTDSRLNYNASLQTPYIDTTGMCLELYYQVKSTAAYNKPKIRVVTVNEELNYNDSSASIVGENRTSWDRMFATLPDGLHRIQITGFRSSSKYCGMSIDDVVVQPCVKFGEFFSQLSLSVCLSVCLSVSLSLSLSLPA